MLPLRGTYSVDNPSPLNCSVTLLPTTCRWRGSRHHWPDRSALRIQQKCEAAAADAALPPGSSSANGQPPTAPQQQRSLQPPAPTAPQQQQQQQQQQHSPQPRGRLQAAQSFMQQHGIGAFLSYITVSNTVSVFMLSSAWILFTRTVGLTPLAPGQWPKFVLFYGGAYAMQHVARPVKVAIGLAGTSLGSAVIQTVAEWFDISDKAALVLLLVVQAMLLLSCLGCVAIYAQTLALASCSAA